MNFRIRELRKALGLNQKTFAEKIGLKQNAISHIEQNGSTITEQTIKAICSQFFVNEEWLRTGSGKMFLEIDRKQKEFFDIFNELSPSLQDYLIKTARDLLDAQSKMFADANMRNGDSYRFTAAASHESQTCDHPVLRSRTYPHRHV